MPTQLSFAEFDTKLKSGTLSKAEYKKYLEVDPTSPTVRLRFKPGQLRDNPPAGYDVDREVYLAERAQQEREIVGVLAVGKKRVVAEGDSWFNLPPIVRPKAIVDRLKSNGRVHVKNIAKWGHTLEQILNAKEYLTEIPRFKPDYFIFSGGGNDLQNSLEQLKLVLPYDATRPLTDSISPEGTVLLTQIASGYRAMLNQIALLNPSLPTFCYGYDYPRPTYKSGKYLGQYLTALGYPASTQDEVAKVIVDALFSAIAPVVSAFPNARFIECRKVTKNLKFYDDFHPDKDGFKALARKFEEAMEVTAPSAGQLGLRKHGAKPQRKTSKAHRTPTKKSTFSRANTRVRRKKARRSK